MLGLALALTVLPAHGLADGSWVATAPALRVVMAERESLSRPLRPPQQVPAEAEIETVLWRFEQPSDANLRGHLCQGSRCIDLPQMRGRSRGLAGLSAAAPLRFHFSLDRGQQRAALVRGLQIIVNYRAIAEQ
jgi:flagellar protein FlhE